MALNINIHTPNGLVPISPELTYQLIVDVLGYTPLDVSNYVTYDSISEADDSAFYVVDSQLHILAQIDEDGLQAAIMTVNGKDVESGLIYDIKELADDAFYIVDSQSNVIAKIGENGLETTNVIALSIITNNIESSDSELYIVDTNNRPILSVDANGLETTNVIAVDAILSLHSVVDHIEDYEIHITEEERQSWNNKSKFDSISEDDNTTLYINDKNNKTIAKFDADGLTVTNVSTNDVTVGDNKSVLSHINNSSVHITDDERTTWNTVTSKASKTELNEHINDTDKHLGDEISLDDNSTLYINDKDNKTIVKVNSEGLTAAEVILQSDKELHSLLEHVTNTDIHIQEGERDSWNAKIDSSTLEQKLAEKTDKTDFNAHVQDTNLHIGDEITLDDNTTLYINDAGGNVIAKFDASGLNVGDLFLNNQHVATEEYVNGKVTGLFEFKGSISSNAEVPAVHEVGDTYRIAVKGEYAGKTCEEGDMLVCIVNGSTANNEDWTVLQLNWTAVDGSSTLKWGEAVTLATIGGVTIDAKLPNISSITSKIATGTNGSTNNITTELTDPYINHVEGSVVNSSVQFKGANTATVKAKNGVITIDSGVTSGEKDKWDEVVNKVDTSVYNAGQAAQNSSINKLFEDKVDKSVYNTDKTALNKTILDISTELGTKANQTDFEEHINDTDLHLGDEISLIDNTALYVNDKDGKTIIRVDSKGLTAANISTNEVIVNGKSVVELIDNTSLHINNDDVHLVDGERTKWNTVDNKVDTSVYNTYKIKLDTSINKLFEDKLDISVYNSDKIKLDTSINKLFDDKVDTSVFDNHTSNTSVHLVDGERTKWNAVVNKVDTSVYNAGQAAQDASIDELFAIKVNTSVYNAVQAALDTSISKLFTDKVDKSVYNTDKNALNNTISDISTKVGTKANQTDFEEHINNNDLHLGDEISLTDDSTLYITDKDGKIIVRVDEDGLAASNLLIDDKDVATKEYVNSKVTGLFEFKDSISSNAEVPAVHEVGDAYRINKPGEYVGETCEAGDMLVCIADGSTANNDDWTVLQQNWTAVDGSSTLKWGEVVTLATIGGVNIDAKLPANPDTTYQPGTGLDLSGTTFNHKNSITAGAISGGSGLLKFKDSITIPSIAYDSEGHITNASTTSYTLPDNPNVTSKIAVGTNGSINNTTNEVANPYINHVEGSVVNSSLQIVSVNTATVKAKNGVITIDSGITSADVSKWNKVTDKLDTSVYNEDKIELDASIAALFTNKVDISVYNAGQNAQNASISDINNKIGTKANQTDFEEHINNNDLHLGDEISLDDNTTLYITDKVGAIIAKFTQSGFDAKLIRQDDNVVASNVIVDASTDTPYIDEDGTLHLTAGVIDTNTTYTFTEGTNKFTVTPSNASSYDVSVTPSITVSATATDDDVVVLKGTPGTNGVTYNASHAKKGPKKAYMRQNNPTNVSSGTTTLWIPQIAVDDYGHVTDASNASVAITIPTAIKGDSVTDAIAGTSTDSGGYTITPITFKVGDTDLQPVNVKAKHGSDGKSISSVTLKSGNSTSGTTDEYSVKVDTTEVGTFNVYQGKDFEYKDFTAEQLAALTGPKGDQGLTIKGSIVPSKVAVSFPQISKINDAYVVSRDASSGEYPENAKKGDLWICTKESELICEGEKCTVTNPVFNFSGVNLCGPAGKDGTSVTIKGSKDTADELPEEGNTNGDGYIVLGILFVWDGTNWTEAGEIKGPKGDPGPKGDQGFNIRGEISALIDLDNIASVLNPNPPKINDAWILNPNYDDTIYPDNAKKGAVWVYRGEGVPFEYVTNLRGPAGEYTSGTNIDITDNVISAKGYLFNEIVNSFAEGYDTRAEGSESHAEGYGTTSDGPASHAEGYASHAEGNYSHAEGNKTTAQGKSSHAEGNGVEAVGEASHAEGWHDIDSENNLTYTVHIDEGDNTKYVVVSDFRGTTGGEDGFYLKYGMTFLYNNIYYYVTEVLYDDSNVKPIAFRLNQAIDKQDTENFDIKLILGKSIGTASHVEGNNTIAYGHHAHAEGNTTRAIGANSHTEGAETTAIGDRSHAEGSGSVAIGNYSHTEGRLTKTSSVAAHAEGINTAATNEAEHAEGKYNVSNTGSEEKDKTISSIGIGESNIDRKNAFEVMQNGDIYIKGIGDYDGTNAVIPNSDNKIGKSLQDYLEDYKLPQKENELIYFVENEGFVSNQLLLQDDTIIIDNLEDYNSCTKLSDVETDVLGSWQQFTDWKTYSPEYGSGQYITDNYSYGYSRWYSVDSKILNPINSNDFNGYMIPFAKSSYSIESILGTDVGNTTGDNIGFSIVNDKNAIPKHVETESGKKYYRNTLYDILQIDEDGNEIKATPTTPQRPSKSAWVCEDKINNTAYVIYIDSPTTDSTNESYPTIDSEYNVYFIDNIKTSAGRKKYKVSDLEDNSVFTEKIITNIDASGVIDFVTLTVTNSSSMQIGHGIFYDYEGTIYVYGSRYDISSSTWTNQLVFSGNINEYGRLLVDYNSNLNTNNSNVKCVIKASTDFNNGILTVEFSDAISDIENAKIALYNGSELKIDFNNRKYFITPRNSYNNSTIIEQDLPVSIDIDDNFWSGFTQETKFMYHAYSYQNLYIECLNILMDNKIIWVHNDGTNTEYGLNSSRDDYEIKGNISTKDILSGSRLAYNPITKKLFYSDGDIIYQIASSSGGNSSGDNGGNSSGDSGSVGSQSFGGYVYIEKYDKTNFENALTTALSDAKTKYDNGTNKNAIILDCTYFTGTHVLSTGFTGFNLETPVKLVFGSIKVVFNNPGDHNLFNILHNDISIVGINRNTDASQIAIEDTAANGATLFIMNGDNSNSSDNLNGYHIKSSGFKNILIDSITLRGKRSAMGEYYQSTNYPISGIGGIYIEKGDPSGTATSGLTCNNVRINNVLISETKAHGIYINTPILSSITNTRLSGCGGHGIYILGGTSINMENVYASSGNFAGFCIQNASYVQLANCVAETFGIGFLIRGSNSVTLHCPGVEQTSNFGRYPWRNTLTSGKISTSTNSNLGIYGLGLVHTGTTNIIKDVVSDLENCFIGYGIYITGGDGINVFSPYIKSIGQSKSGTIGYTNSTTPSDKLNFISVVGTANLVNIINPHFKMSSEDSTIIGTIKNEIKIGEDAKYVDISYSTDSSPLKENVEGVLKYTTSSSDKACIYTVDGENIDTITLKIDNVYESLFAKTMYAENGFFETSDARKKDIQGELPLDKAYDFIRNCEPILYNLKGSDKTQIGLIAQEVREFFPEIVNEDDEGYLTLDYAKLTVVILRVLKDLIDLKK